ncbi:hypothetical protein [Caballeronia calidae]|uniref:hypothetical protein n=1 Tax=Caballeronia calidae TaxID=1777139 RepID=UPI0012FD717A|nr:hypothetical protein [Caballeronia calidae]
MKEANGFLGSSRSLVCPGDASLRHVRRAGADRCFFRDVNVVIAVFAARNVRSSRIEYGLQLRSPSIRCNPPGEKALHVRRQILPAMRHETGLSD